MAVAKKKRVVKRKEQRNRPKQPPKHIWLKQRKVWGALLSLFILLVAAFYLWQSGVAEVEVPDVELEIEPVTAKQATLAGKIVHVQPQQISRLVNEHGKVGMLAMDPEQLRIAIEALPWVYRARVRKVWPDQLDLWIDEQRAAAIWGERGYLNLDGIYFESDGVALPEQQLPTIVAEQKDTVAIYQQLMRLTEILSTLPLGAVERMAVDNRGAISLTLQGGLKILLGRRVIEKRLKRWVAQASVILDRFKGRVAGVDLRYERGMVLQLKPTPKAKKRKR